ncbi:ATP-binding response regulator [Rugamonas apoptosis]|uniref:histidine kinase n=1 Tax=Rugamonas apoptosis TaxID=2758570 RepID=A0A7W2FCP0_9BURK|nr:response regulator [Rugamonas apoptosis]MBA5689293.1 response regulator [Rugamonas apoptosis]
MNEPGDRPRILIVDDEAAHMQALCSTLRDHGYDTRGYDTGQAALDALRPGAYDLLLADLMMPGMDGIMLVQAARAIDPDLASIIMTGEGSIASAVRAMKVGALDYIIKPFKVSTILPVLARALETRMLRLENAKLESQLRAHAAEMDALNQDLEVARQQAERANQEKSTFLSHMSHELRTPLNAILGFAQILTSDKLPSTPDEKQAFARHILQAGRHLLTLINEVLDLAKIESGAMTLSLEPVALARVFQECQAMIQPLATRRGIELRFPARAPAHVLADRTRLKQVLINLLSNAVKYNRERGTVALDCVAAQPGRVRIAVRDTGAGLTAAQLALIFQPFNRLGQEGSAEEGTGIGLALTKRLMEAMRGQIGVASMVGVGSTFWIELPATDAGVAVSPELVAFTPVAPLPAPAPGADVSADVRAAGSVTASVAASVAAALPVTPDGGHTLLYVEDNPANLQLIADLLRLRRGVALLSATDGEQGLALARQHRPHLILMDIHLNGMDGLETRRRLLADPATAHIPVIAISASAMPEQVRHNMAAGFFRYLTKPIDVAAFTEAVDSALRLPSPTKEEQDDTAIGATLDR